MATLDLAGVGASYLRVSTDLQDTERQYASIRSFEKCHKVSIAKRHWFEDHGFARDEAEDRPAFQNLLKLAARGDIQWIVIDRLDRFGTKDKDELAHYRYLLRKAKCKLFDVSGKEWTSADMMTFIEAGLQAEQSQKEQHEKSYRVLGGKIEKARAGEWQGGPLKLAFDVACYNRDSGEELWRVIYEGKNERVKVWPDGRTERFDGPNNFPKVQPTEVLRIAPSHDKAKVSAAVSIFKRYATESITFTALAQHLNALGFRTSYGGYFQSQHVERMLEDPAYIGYYAFNRIHAGKFNRYRDGQVELELNYEEKLSKNRREDWVQSERLFKPLIDRKTWDAVQRKLEQRTTRAKAPKSPALYLSGLVYCATCNGKMVASGPSRKAVLAAQKNGTLGDLLEYMCGTYFKAVREGWREQCSCLRNAVLQRTLEEYVDRYLVEAGHRLELLTEGLNDDELVSRLDQRAEKHWDEFYDGIARLTKYLAKNHPDQYNALQREFSVNDLGPDEFVEACVECYRENFDPSGLSAEVAKLEAEHDALMERWADLPTARAKEKAKERFNELEARIAELRRQGEDVAEVVASNYREIHDLQSAIADARLAMRSEQGERALRQRAEAVRGVIQRIECTFTATGAKGGGWGKRNSKLAQVKIYPICGESVAFSVESESTLMYSNAHSRI